MAWNINMSGWRDSNSRPRRPERRALTGLRYTPKTKTNAFTPLRLTKINFQHANISILEIRCFQNSQIRFLLSCTSFTILINHEGGTFTFFMEV